MKAAFLAREAKIRERGVGVVADAMNLTEDEIERWKVESDRRWRDRVRDKWVLALRRDNMATGVRLLHPFDPRRFPVNENVDF